MPTALLPVFAENEDPRRMALAGLTDLASRFIAGFVHETQGSSRDGRERPDDLVERHPRALSDFFDFHAG